MTQKLELWQRLRQARTEANITQAIAARRLGVSTDVLAGWESVEPATRTHPSPNQVTAFAEMCRMPVERLVD